MKIVGVCGNTGSGKSTVCGILRENGFRIIDCDRVYSSLVTPPSELLGRIEEAFGPGVISADGSLDRKALSAIVFSDRDQLEKLNRLTFTYIIKRVKKILTLYKNNKARCAVIDAPLLFESGLDKICDCTLAVTCPEDVRLERLAARDGSDKKELKKRMASQADQFDTAKKCDYVIENFAGLEELKENALLFIETLDRGGEDEKN